MFIVDIQPALLWERKPVEQHRRNSRISTQIFASNTIQQSHSLSIYRLNVWMVRSMLFELRTKAGFAKNERECLVCVFGPFYFRWRCCFFWCRLFAYGYFHLKSISSLYVCVLLCFRYILFGDFGSVSFCMWRTYFIDFDFFSTLAQYDWVAVVYLIRFRWFYLFSFFLTLVLVSLPLALFFYATLLHWHGSAFTGTRILHITLILHNTHLYTPATTELYGLNRYHVHVGLGSTLHVLRLDPVLSSEAPFRVTISPNNTHPMPTFTPQSLAAFFLSFCLCILFWLVFKYIFFFVSEHA